MTLLKRSDPDAEREVLAQRVHGVTRTCSMCGAAAPCDTTEVVYRRTLGGDDVMFGRCRDCVKLGADWSRKVAAALLRLDADAVVLEGLKVDRFIDRPGADPTRPNARPWAHVNVATLTKAAEAAQVDLDHRRGPAPCDVCGATLTPRGTTWATARGSDGPRCGRCTAWFASDAYSITTDGIRIVATSILLGRSTPTLRHHGPPGLAEQVGITLWTESALTRGTIEPFGWLDVKAINERLAGLGSTERIDPARWRQIDGRKQ